MNPHQRQAPLAPHNCLGVFAKYWEPGTVKTRLAAAVGDVAAAQIYQTFVATTLTRLTTIPAQRVLAVAPATPSTYAACAQLVNSAQPAEVATSTERDGWSLTAQAQGDLGQRMHAFFTDRFRAGAHSVVLLGTDSPNLPLAHVHQAFAQLQTCDVVLGPTADGGYYLVGARQTTPPIFTDVPWSTPEVYACTQEKLEQANLRYGALEPWYDVDDLRDLRRLLHDINPSHDPHLVRLQERVQKIIEHTD